MNVLVGRYHCRIRYLCEVRGMPEFPIRQSVCAWTNLLLDLNWICESGMSFGNMSLFSHSYFVPYFESRRTRSPLFVTICLDLGLTVGDTQAHFGITMVTGWQWQNGQFGSHFTTKHQFKRAPPCHGRWSGTVSLYESG